MWILSEILRKHVKQMDDDFVDNSDPDEREAAAEYVTCKVASYLLESLEGFEGFSGRTFSNLEAAFDMHLKIMEESYKRDFDEHYTRDLLQRIPKMVARTMRLSRMIPRKMPSTGTNLYLKEATRSYVFGFWQGSVALSRAAVELGLREEIGQKLPLGNLKFCDLVTAATRLRLLDNRHVGLARSVEHAGNRVLHGKPSSDRESWETLSAARKVLLCIYGQETK